MSTLENEILHPAGQAAPSYAPSEGGRTKPTSRREVPKSVSAVESACLRCVWSPDAAAIGLTIPLDGRSVELGRGEEVSHRIQDHEMSRRHVRLVATTGDGYRICDLDTPNGTHVDGQRVEGELPFEGRVLAAGASLFVVDAPPDSDALPAAFGAPEAAARGLIGVSSVARRLRRAVATVARSDSPALLLGATGVGKEVTAQAIHEASGRAGPFVPVNCAAIPANLEEAELFGAVRGAYTGAEVDRAGVFEQAHGGTLFLDEVADLPLPAQAKLLRVLEDGAVRRLGASDAVEVDVRVIAATQVDLDASGFRRDLLGRLGGCIIRIPPLSERKSDILTLWEHFCGTSAFAATSELREALLLYDWPMNIRELGKLARRTTELARPGEPLDIHLLPRPMRAPLMPRLDRARIASVQPIDPLEIDESKTPGRQFIIDALVASRGNVKKVALDHGWHRTQLYRWLDRLRIDPKRYRPR